MKPMKTMKPMKPKSTQSLPSTMRTSSTSTSLSDCITVTKLSPSKKGSKGTTSGSSSSSTTQPRRPRISRWAIQEIAEVCDDQVQTPEIQSLPHISRDDLEVMSMLGEGGFSTVYQVRYGEEILALKQLRKYKRGREEEDWVLAVFDLCNEISLLAKLSPHENIVSIWGVCDTAVSKAYRHQTEGYFFVMEKLEDTLHNRLDTWRQQTTSRQYRLRRKHQQVDLSDFRERLENVAIGIARAMSHLHSMEFQIAIRDLKPQNIGFDKNGVVKLFDLGMARPVHETDTAELAGTFRYISPEAMMGHRISLESDVYSFGVILYELVTLLKPFEQYFQKGKLVRKEAFVENVVIGCWRPSLSHISCRATRRLIENCWDPAPRARPCFDRIYFLLNQIVTVNTPAVVDPTPVTTSTAATTTTTTTSTPSTIPTETSSTGSSITKTTPETTTSDGSTAMVHRTNSSFRGLFRGLKPLSKKSNRMCSDVTVDTTISRSTPRENP